MCAGTVLLPITPQIPQPRPAKPHKTTTLPSRKQPLKPVQNLIQLCRCQLPLLVNWLPVRYHHWHGLPAMAPVSSICGIDHLAQLKNLLPQGDLHLQQSLLPDEKIAHVWCAWRVFLLGVVLRSVLYHCAELGVVAQRLEWAVELPGCCGN